MSEMTLEEALLWADESAADIDGASAEVLKALAAEVRKRQWISVKERLPEAGAVVLAFYLTERGFVRIIRAFYAPKYTLDPGGWDDEGVDEYCEDKDAYFLAEGWWECIENWDTYDHVKVHQGYITHWMPLPAPPKEPTT